MKNIAVTQNGLNLPVKTYNRQRVLRNYGMVIVLLGLVVLFSVLSPFFATLTNAVNILNSIAVVGIVAIGMTIVILTGGIDLSVGSMLGLACLVSANLAVQPDATLLYKSFAFAAPLALGLIMGAINGGLVATNYIAPFVVTLATLQSFRGFAVWYHVSPIYGLPPWYRTLGAESAFGLLPYSVIVYLIVVAAAHFFLAYTKFGREIYAVGGNERASRASGIHVRRTKFVVYAISGLCVGLAAILQNGRVGGGQSYAGNGLELRAIAAVIIGGVSLFGGRGTIVNAVTGTLVLGVLFNGLVLLNVPAPIQDIIIGAILVAAVLFDGIYGRNTK